MDEVLSRRLGRLLDERCRDEDEAGPLLVDPTTGAPRKFSYAPALIVVDGGAPQVTAAARVLEELDLACFPVSRVAGLVPPVERSPCKPGSVTCSIL